MFKPNGVDITLIGFANFAMELCDAFVDIIEILSLEGFGLIDPHEDVDD